MKENRFQINTDINLSISLLGCLKCPAGWIGANHFHTFWEMVISTCDFENFDVNLFSPNENHKLNNNSKKENHLLYIGFDFKYDKTADINKIKDNMLHKLNEKSNYYMYKILFNNLKEENFVSRNSSLYTKIMIFIMEVIGKYMFSYSDEILDTALISDVKKYINSNLDKKISINKLAKSFYITPKYLGQIFKAEVGEGILQYVKRKKVEKALLMLKSGEYTITQISQILGFDNVQYFSTAFKSYYFFPPSHFYKKDLRK